MPEPSPAPPDSLSWQQNLVFMQALMIYPALTVMVFLRKRVGFRQLNPTRLIGMSALLFFLGYVAAHPLLPDMPFVSLGASDGAAIYGGYALMGYAAAMLVFGLWQRRRRWMDLRNGVRWHTRTTGISYFDSLSPSTYIIHRYVDPIACFIVGAVLVVFLRPLGLWLIFSAGALATYEQAVAQKALERDLDMLDGMVEAEIQAETAQHFQKGGQGQTAQTRRTLEETAGIPTGMAPDIKEQIFLRRKRAPVSDSAVSDNPPLTPEGFSYSPGLVHTGAELVEPVVTAGVATATVDAALPPEEPEPSRARSVPDNLA